MSNSLTKYFLLLLILNFNNCTAPDYQLYEGNKTVGHLDVDNKFKITNSQNVKLKVNFQETKVDIIEEINSSQSTYRFEIIDSTVSLVEPHYFILLFNDFKVEIVSSSKSISNFKVDMAKPHQGNYSYSYNTKENKEEVVKGETEYKKDSIIHRSDFPLSTLQTNDEILNTTASLIYRIKKIN